MKYQCDIWYPTSQPYVHRERCPKHAVIALERDAGCGLELFYFCQYHTPSNFSSFDAVYLIKNGELVETGISKWHRQQLESVPTKEFVTQAIKRHNEKKSDTLFMRELGVKYP